MSQSVQSLGQLLDVWGSPGVKPRWFGPALSTRVHWLSPRFCLRLASAARAWGCRALERCWSPNREDAASNTARGDSGSVCHQRHSNDKVETVFALTP